MAAICLLKSVPIDYKCMRLFLFKIKKFFVSLPDSFRRTRVKAVYDSDLKNLIDFLGIEKEIESGTHNCKFCNSPITFENLQAIQKDGGELKFICTKNECFSKL